MIFVFNFYMCDVELPKQYFCDSLIKYSFNFVDAFYREENNTGQS